MRASRSFYCSSVRLFSTHISYPDFSVVTCNRLYIHLFWNPYHYFKGIGSFQTNNYQCLPVLLLIPQIKIRRQISPCILNIIMFKWRCRYFLHKSKWKIEVKNKNLTQHIISHLLARSPLMAGLFVFCCCCCFLICFVCLFASLFFALLDNFYWLIWKISELEQFQLNYSRTVEVGVKWNGIHKM